MTVWRFCGSKTNEPSVHFMHEVQFMYEVQFMSSRTEWFSVTIHEKMN